MDEMGPAARGAKPNLDFASKSGKIAVPGALFGIVRRPVSRRKDEGQAPTLEA